MPSSTAPRMPSLGAGTVSRIPFLDAEAAFLAVAARHDDVVWLDSGSGGVHVIGTGATRVVLRDPSTAIGDLEQAMRLQAVDGVDGPWMGWLGYQAGVAHLGLPPAERASGAGRFADAAWLLLDSWVVIDEQEGVAELQTREPGAPFLDLTPLPQHASSTEPPHASMTEPPRPPMPVVWRDDDAAYRASIEACMRHIHDGDAYLMCLTTAAEAGPIDAVRTHLRLRRANPVHHGGFVRIGGEVLSSASPEQFLVVDGLHVSTKPIKGTARRGSGTGPASEDARLALALRDSEKEQAENLMIVDLCRNDLQRVCEPGTVDVTSLFAVESYPAVHQLVSTIEGRLRADSTVFDVVRAMFPAGSMTGAPKRRAVELLLGLEGSPRGIYSGCFGVMTGDRADLAMVIRSIASDASGAHIGVGGGITALSDPAAEVDEVRLKARALIAALVPAA